MSAIHLRNGIYDVGKQFLPITAAHIFQLDTAQRSPSLLRIQCLYRRDF